MKTPKVRTRKGTWGGIAVETLGAKPMARFDAAETVGKADDYDLIRALAMRGYDVKIRQPTEDKLARRVARLKRLRAVERAAARRSHAEG